MASWNVWWRFGPWWARQPAIAATLAEIGADVFGLQEVWVEEDGAHQAEVLARRLGYHYTTGELRFWEGVGFTNAILSRWPIRESGSIRLPGRDGAPGHRQAVWAAIDAPAPIGRLVVVCTHLDWQFDQSAVRAAQTRAVAELVFELRNDPATGFPAVLLGDLNAVPDSDEVRQLTGASAPPIPNLVFTDAWLAVGNTDPGWTWSGHNPHLADSTWPNRRIDYVFVSWPRPKPMGSIGRCWLAGQEPRDGVVPSDHYAVVAELRTS